MDLQKQKILRGGKNTQKNYTKKVFRTLVTMMELSLTENQTSWSGKSSGSQEALLQTKLVEVMEFQLKHKRLFSFPEGAHIRGFPIILQIKTRLWCDWLWFISLASWHLPFNVIVQYSLFITIIVCFKTRTFFITFKQRITCRNMVKKVFSLL